MFYNDFTFHYFNNLTNDGIIKNPTHEALIGSIEQESIVKLQLIVESNIIKEVKYKVFGNVALIVSMEYLATKIKGKTIQEALNIPYTEIVEFFNLTSMQINSAMMAVDSIKKCF